MVCNMLQGQTPPTTGVVSASEAVTPHYWYHGTPSPVLCCTVARAIHQSGTLVNLLAWQGATHYINHCYPLLVNH